MKRYRDTAGRLTITTEQLAAETQEEGKAYYQEGAQYIHNGKIYTLHRYTRTDEQGHNVEIAHFESADGYSIFTDPARLGTFLPNVASDGLEIIRI